jgi:hypothetical protein
MTPKFWNILQIWDGDPCVIIGGGPSVAGFDVGKLKGYRVVAVNMAYQLSDKFEAMFYGDRYWYLQYGNKLTDFPGLKITNCEADLGKPAIQVVKRKNEFGISKNPEFMNWNLSSGATAIGLAAQLGAGKIILLGFDMCEVNGENNFHDIYPEDTAHPYHRFKVPFPIIAEHLKAMNIECINATPFIDGKPLSTLEDFLRIPIEEAL